MLPATKTTADFSQLSVRQLINIWGDAFFLLHPPETPTKYRLTADEEMRMREPDGGAIAQLGERLNGIQEVRSSILLGSTNLKDFGRKKSPALRRGFCISGREVLMALPDDVPGQIWPSHRVRAAVLIPSSGLMRGLCLVSSRQARFAGECADVAASPPTLCQRGCGSRFRGRFA